MPDRRRREQTDMTTSPPEADIAAADPTPPVSFVRWAVGVLVPLLAYEALVFVLMDERAPSVGVYLVPIVYVAAFMFRCGVVNGFQRGHAVAAGALAFLMGVACFVFPVPPGVFIPAAWVAYVLLPGPFPAVIWIVAPVTVGVLLGLALSIAHWIAYPHGIRSFCLWFLVHAAGAGVGAALLAFLMIEGLRTDYAYLEGMIFWLVASPLVVLPHLYLTWLAQRRTAADAAPATEPRSSILAAPLLRNGCAALAVYGAVAVGRVVSIDMGWHALAWPYYDMEMAGVFGFYDRPYGEAPITIGGQAYLITAEWFDTVAAKDEDNAYSFVVLRIRFDSIVDRYSAPPELLSRFVEIKLSEGQTAFSTIRKEAGSTEVACRSRHLGPLTTCWNVDQSIPFVWIPQASDYSARIEPDIGTDGVLLFDDDPAQPGFEIRCHRYEFECAMVFDDGRIQVLVRFSATLLPYWNEIRGWVDYQLEDTRRRAETFGKPFRIDLDRSPMDSTRHPPLDVRQRRP